MIPVLTWLGGAPVGLVAYPVLLLPLVGVRKLMYIYDEQRQHRDATTR
jgi:hypothetical protein